MLKSMDAIEKNIQAQMSEIYLKLNEFIIVTENSL